MPPEGFADPVTGDGTGFRLNMLSSELAEHVTQAIEAGGINSTPPVAKTVDRATITKMNRPLTESPPRVGLGEGSTCKETERTVTEQ